VNELTSTGLGNATATVHWKTNKPDATTGSVDFGTDTSYGGTAVSESSNNNTIHSVTLTGLSENTKYYYQITSGAGINTGSFFTTNSTAPAGNPGTLAYTDNTNSNSGMVMVQNENNFALDGSSYLFWINSNAVCGIHWAAGGGISATNTAIGTGTSVKASSDGYGRAIATWVNGANVYGSLVDSGMTSTAFNSGSAIAPGANPSVAIVWDPIVTNISTGTAEVFADSTNYIYDYDYDLSAIGIVDTDMIFLPNVLNSNNNHNGIVTNNFTTGITSRFRHVIERDNLPAMAIGSGVNYQILDHSSGYGPSLATDYYVYTSRPQSITDTFTSPQNTEQLDHIYSPYTTSFTAAQAVANRIVGVEDVSSGWYYRTLSGSSTITFGTAAEVYLHTEYYSGNTADTVTSSLIDYGIDFTAAPYLIALGDIVVNSTGDIAEVTDILQAASGILGLSSAIFSSDSESYTIYSKLDTTGSHGLGGTNTSLTTNNILDSNAGSLDLSGIVLSTDIINNSGTYGYSWISSVDDPTDTIYLSSAILDGINMEPYALFRLTQKSLGSESTSPLLIDNDVAFTSSGLGASDVVENTTGTTFAKIIAVYDYTIVLDNDIFAGAADNYIIHSGEYNTLQSTSYPDQDLFTSFVDIVLDVNSAAISADALRFTIYDLLIFSVGVNTSTTDTRPANPLFDNTGTFNTDSIIDDYLVVNSTDRAWSRVNDALFTVRERALDMQADIMTTDGAFYHILDFNPAIADLDIRCAGTVSTAGNPFTDSGADFSTAGVSEGDIIYNMTDQTYAVVTVVDSAQQLTLTAGIMAAGEAYIILNHFTVNPDLQSVSRALVAYSRSGNIHAQRVNLSDGSLYGAEIDIDISGSDSNPYATSNGLGGAFIVYQNGASVNVRSCDSTGAIITAALNLASSTLIDVKTDGSGGIYVLRTDGTSVILGRYTTNGLTVSTDWTTTAGTGTMAALAVDPSGDPVVAYVDASTIWPRNIQVLGLLQSDGSTAAGYPEPILTSSHPYLTSIVGLKITSDRTGAAVNTPGGAIVTWADNRYYSSLGYDIFAQAVNDSGALANWTVDPNNDGSGTLVGVASSFDDAEISTALAFYADGGTPYGGLFLWLDYRDGIADIYDRLLSR
jgi:hypothetical protein